ncbi:MAG: inorganic phosphate transporter [Acidobacteria bacterium ACB1]|nr:inorganic phosphate transporter [Acidobacteria bacterium ACB1]
MKLDLARNWPIVTLIAAILIGMAAPLALGLSAPGFYIEVLLGGLMSGVLYSLVALGFVLMVSVYWIFRRVSVGKVDKVFRVGQLLSAAAFSLGHGGNDAQKTMGIITIALVAGGFAQMEPSGKLPTPELWVILAAHTAIALGTLSGGWRIVKTMGSKIAKLQPVQGFCAESSGALTLFVATFFGIPVSTTHTITGSIAGAGSAKRFSAVKWDAAGRIVWAWILTIPAAGVISTICYFLILLIERLLGVGYYAAK